MARHGAEIAEWYRTRIKNRARHGAETVAETVAEWYRTDQIKPFTALAWAIITATALWFRNVDPGNAEFFTIAALIATFMLSRYIGRFCSCSCCTDDTSAPKHTGAHERIEQDG